MRRAGFTLVELVVTIVVLGVLAGVALPRLRDYRETSQASMTARTFKNISNALHQYYLDNRMWPADQTVVNTPVPGLDPYLDSSVLRRPPPMGGNWDWNNLNWAFYAIPNMSIQSVPNPTSAPVVSVFTRIDTILDDGDLSTGVFRYDTTFDQRWCHYMSPPP